jgi:outer membrane lipoprotein-sorting protein
MKQKKWLFVNGCEHKSQISTVTEFVNSYQNGTNASAYLEIVLKDNETTVEQMNLYIQRCNDFSFNLYDLGNRTYWTPSYTRI